VKVDVAEEGRIDAVREALEQAGAVDIEEQAQGQLDMGSSQDADLRADTSRERSDLSAAAGGVRGESGEEVLPVMREEVHVGKRVERRGGVRVFTHTEERPVEETVTLREERAHVERRPVDREVSAADLDQARDRTIEVRETTERPMVEKVARVVEEVVVGKEVHQRTEQVRDTVRETKVEVEQLSGGDVQRDELHADEFRADDFREDFDSRYATGGARWEDYEPAYRYGHTLRGDSRYAGRSWDEIEPDVRRDWEGAHPGSAWERFKDSVRHAWERVTR
jgi:stress response protein YsnF